MELELENVKTKIRKMVNLTVGNGCTEGEAISYAVKVGDLLQQYNLTLDVVLLGAEKCSTIQIETERKRRHPIDRCMISLVAFCDCKVWFLAARWYSGMTKSVYNIFGLPHDTELAKNLYAVIWGAFEYETAQFKQSEEYVRGDAHRKRLSVSFQKGMASRLSCRLGLMTKQRHEAESLKSRVPVLTTTRTDACHCTDIVLLKRNKLENEYEELGMHLTKSYASSRNPHWDAYNSGQKAGDRVNLSRPLNSGSGAAKELCYGVHPPL